MKEDSLFDKEERILSRAEAVLERPAPASNEELLREFSSLVRGYRRLIRLTRNLTRVSDRHQHRLQAKSTNLDQELSRHVGAEIKEDILRGSGRNDQIRNQNLTILFIDIRGFTSFAEQRPPDEVIRFLKSYYEYSLDIVHRHKGFVKSFMGDGVMLVFGYNQEDHTANGALDCAFEILDRLPEFNREHGTSIQIGIGIHSGPTAVGNIGTRDRTEFAVIGNTVNTASRIEAETKVVGTPLLFSSTVVDLLVDYPRVPVFVSTFALRGQLGWVDLFTFDGLQPRTR